MRNFLPLWLLACLAFSLGRCCDAVAAEPPTIALINGQTLTADQLQLEFYLSQLPDKGSLSERMQVINKLIDRELVRQFLVERRIKTDPAVLDQKVADVERIITQRGEKPEDVLNRLHLTKEQLRELFAVNAAWDAYLEAMVTRPQMQAEFDANRGVLDGTRVKASQIVIFVKPNASNEAWRQAEEQLEKVRHQIVTGEITFADAAKKYSQSPSGKNGGDLGEFEYTGRVDTAISKVAFNLQNQEVSLPFRTRFGVHLVQVHDRLPGQLSLEDVQGVIVAKLSERLWADVVLRERQKASIQVLAN
ncbi:peptidylprolyl isomerase [Planctomicrobium piriforme]|uniref:Parvulin-like peptidyl-prolyl isomerase n=1 Tax=Planctomicrobium piriforme TaxID=1576369 RepID=A0A1I3BED2_9PLAN|nr:peptidylprolyl isomerase [Planctomicrobium piriforme]SFH60051.1 Parvulin-like peptidyl-prolyl isomerase [Planctomicrobium piriforme]